MPTTYPPAENGNLARLLKISFSDPLYSRKLQAVRFSRTGEYRTPQPEEWYLSGAEPQAWMMPRNTRGNPEPYTGSEYHILKPTHTVETKTVEILTPL